MINTPFNRLRGKGLRRPEDNKVFRFLFKLRQKENSVADKRMLIVDSEVARRIDENRGDLTYSEFLNFLIDSQLKEEARNQNYVDKEEFHQFAQGMKELLRNFLEFFLSYGLELGKQPQDKTFEELSQKLQALGGSGNKSKKL